LLRTQSTSQENYREKKTPAKSKTKAEKEGELDLVKKENRED